MRIRFFLAAASASFVMVGALVQACGGDSDSSSTPTPDASTADTATKDVSTDTSADDGAVDAGCDPNKDYLASLPDASLADGASTTGICVACVQSKCQTQVSACGASCECQGIAASALNCFVTMNGNVLACAEGLATVSTGTQTLGVALFECVSKDCSDECAVGSFLDGGDGGDGGAP